MKLGIYTPNYPAVSGTGGIGSYTRTLAWALSDRGHSVHLLTPGEGKSRPDGPVTVHLTSTRHLPLVDRLLPGAGACWRVGRRMGQLVRKHGLDLVEFPNWEGLGIWFQRWTTKPVVVRLHTSSRETQVIDALPGSRLLRWDVRREHQQAQKAQALVTHSMAHQQLMSRELGIEPGKIHIIPHGVQIDRAFERPPRQPSPLRVVFVGRLEKRKGVTELLQAVPEVLQQVPETQFHLIGADRPHAPGNCTHQAWAESTFPLEIRKQVRFLGPLPQDQVDSAMQDADVFVAPSRYESFGLVFPEAMRWGTPVIGTSVGGIPEIVQDGVSGLLVPPERPTELAAAIIRLLREPDLRFRLGQAGRQRVAQEFSAERMAERVERFYESLLTRKG